MSRSALSTLPSPKSGSESRRELSNPTRCGCGAVWSGLSTCHCAAKGCHQTFTGITAFDQHRAGSHTTRRFCVDPAIVGLVDAGRPYPCWGSPNEDDRWD